MNQRWLAILLLGIGFGLSACSDDSDDGGGGDGGGGDPGGGSGGASGSTTTGGRGGASGASTGGVGSGTEVVHCVVEDDMGAVTGCQDLTTPAPAVEAVRQACEDDGGTVVDACPSEGRVGRCTYVTGALTLHYYEPDDPVEIEEMCLALMGTWMDG